MKTITKFIALSLIAFALAIAAACSGQPVGKDGGQNSSSGQTISLTGSGATFPKPLYDKWVNEYESVDPNVKIDYQAKGSGGGQKDILGKIVDFGASDDPMSDEDIKKADGEIMHIPTVLGAVVVTYNLEGNPTLKLTPDVIAKIYLGEIKKWNDAAILADNPDAKLPAADISPVYRADSSGTTAVFTDFLSKTNETFNQKVTASKQPNWVTGVGMGAKGNDGVLGQVKQTPNTIGYVELAYAKENKLPVALIKNKAGNFVEPTIENVSAAASNSIAQMPNDMRIKITNADGEKTYPISSYTYILIYKNQTNASKGKALVDFLWWAVSDGEKFAEPLHYAPLPKEVVEKVQNKLNSVTSNGKQLHEGSKAAGK
ncbi:MAG: phosphate ABC transporter substrate-binding protein PstS [Pyrinomonadaceae bacterium]